MIDFVSKTKLFVGISLATMLVSIILLVVYGLKPGIDFTGGAIIQISNSAFTTDEEMDTITQTFQEDALEVVAIQRVANQTLEVKTKPITQDEWEAVRARLEETYEGVEEVSFETIGPLLGQELLRKTFTAVLLAIAGLLVYIGWRFQDRLFGVTAVIALTHDVLVILGAFALFGALWGVEVDVMFVTATLTALAFSVHDTIVLYDRVREAQRRNPKDDFRYVINLGINSTLVRSLSTSLSILFMLVALAVLGGESIRWFVIALILGTIAGAYSSPFTAAPILTWWEERKDSK